jgi:hypothetical protein
MSESPDVYRLKYLISVSHEGGKKRIAVGVTRTWKYHMDIQATFPSSFKPWHAGYVNVPMVNGNEDFDKMTIDGMSEGYQIFPGLRDAILLKQHLSEGAVYFDTDYKPLPYERQDHTRN